MKTNRRRVRLRDPFGPMPAEVLARRARMRLRLMAMEKRGMMQPPESLTNKRLD